MAQWYVKDLSKLTHISVQTLHHYDRINLLQPSVRLANGYRLYSEKDLLKLQQIIALKFFGFTLKKIKILLASDVNTLDHFAIQSQHLEEKASSLLDASKALRKIISDCNRDKSIPWTNIITLIEVYHMAQQLEKTWIGKSLNAEEIKKYAQFEQGLKTRFTNAEKKEWEQDWANLIKEIDDNLDKDPTSQLGIDIGQRCMNMVNQLYGKDYVSLRMAIWEKGFKSGHGADEHGLSPKAVAWLDKAFRANTMYRVLNVLNKIDSHPYEEVVKLWEELLVNMFCDETESRNKLIQHILDDDRPNQNVKNWLKKYYS
jgi:DNA-binding transcriptional MerR regulator